MNYNDYAVRDFETGSKNPQTTQPVQIAACIIDAKKLTVKDSFQSLIKPVEDVAECEKLGIDPIEDEALAVNGLKIEDLRKAPDIKIVSQRYADWINQYNIKQTKWDAPIRCGFNSLGFDDAIENRMFASINLFDKDRNQPTVFHPVYNIDVLQEMFVWFTNIQLPRNSLSLDNLRDYFGIPREGGHDALIDVYDTAEIFVRFLKMKQHLMANNLIKMQGRMAKSRLISREDGQPREYN